MPCTPDRKTISQIAGLVIGLLGGVALAQTLRHLLFGVGPLDPLSLGGVALTLLVMAAIACYLPARRAAQLDPQRGAARRIAHALISY